MIVRYENNQQGAAKVQVKYPGSNFGTMAGNKKKRKKRDRFISRADQYPGIELKNAKTKMEWPGREKTNG